MSLEGLNGFDPFFETGLKKRKTKKLSKMQRRIIIREYQQRRPSEQGLGLAEMIKSKEFKERVELLKRGSELSVKAAKVGYARGRVAAVKLVSQLKKARSKSIYD